MPMLVGYLFAGVCLVTFVLSRPYAPKALAGQHPIGLLLGMLIVIALWPVFVLHWVICLCGSNK